MSDGFTTRPLDRKEKRPLLLKPSGPQNRSGCCAEARWPCRKPYLEMQGCVSCFQSSISFEPWTSVNYRLSLSRSHFQVLLCNINYSRSACNVVFNHASVMRCGVNSYFRSQFCILLSEKAKCTVIKLLSLFFLSLFLLACCMSCLSRPLSCNWTT